jgi:hypothetical protein
MATTDARQQSIRSAKKNWNSRYKEFSARLKATKDAFNGHQNKLGLPFSKIQDPLPTAIITALEGLSTSFQEMVASAQEIADDQSNYSKTRRKKKPKQPRPSAPQTTPTEETIVPPQQDKIVQQLSQLGSTEPYDLEALATNRLSRSWQYFKSMFYRDEIKKQRVSLLRMCADLLYSLRDFQNEVLTINIGNTPSIIQSFQSARLTFSSVHETITRLGEIIDNGKEKEVAKEPARQEEPASAAPTQPASTEQKQSQPAPEPFVPPPTNPTTKELVHNLEYEARAYRQVGLGMPFAQQIMDLTAQFFTTSPNQYQQRLAIRNRLREMRKEMFASIEAQHGKIDQTNTMQSIIDKVQGKQTKAELYELPIIKEGHNALTRFLKRQLTKMRPGNETASLRLDISNSIDEAEKELRAIMDSLHKEVNMKTLTNGVDQLKTILQNIGKPLHIILSLYEKSIYKDPEMRQKFRGRNQSISGDPSLDMLLRRRVRNDLSRGILDEPSVRNKRKPTK